MVIIVSSIEAEDKACLCNTPWSADAAVLSNPSAQQHLYDSKDWQQLRRLMPDRPSSSIRDRLTMMINTLRTHAGK